MGRTGQHEGGGDEIFTTTAPSDAEVIDEHTIPSADADQFELEAGKALAQKAKGDGRR